MLFYFVTGSNSHTNVTVSDFCEENFTLYAYFEKPVATETHVFGYCTHFVGRLPGNPQTALDSSMFYNISF